MLSAPGHLDSVHVLEGRRHRPIAAAEHEAKILSDGETLLEALQRDYKRSLTVERCLEPGQFHPRVYLPVLYADGPPRSAREGGWPSIDIPAFTASLVQLGLLRDSLERIFRVLHPTGHNLSSYGHEVRSLIIVACTEVESAFRSILLANGAVEREARPTTKDYVRLLSPIRLSEYALSLPMYPELASIAPFANWTATEPTGSLDWYDAYNGAKHDRERKFAVATVHNAIQAVMACAALVDAQFGPTQEWNHALGAFFSFDHRPQWRPAQVYIPSFSGLTQWREIRLHL